MLTEKQRQFCYHYAKNKNAEASCLAAGYSKQYSRHNAQAVLRHEAVITEIKKLQQRIEQRAVKSATDVVNEISRIGFSDAVSYLKPDPNHEGRWIGKSPDELSKEERLAVSKVIIRNIKDNKGDIIGQRYSYVLHDKLTALIQMGRHYGLFDDKLKITSGNNPFANVSTEKLLEIKKSFANIMAKEVSVIEGEFFEK